MKTFNSKIAVIAIITLFFALLTTQARAQISIPYKVHNGLQCQVNITWIIYDGTSCGTPCSSGSQLIPAGGSYNIPAPACSSPCAISITAAGTTINYPLQTSVPFSPPLNVGCGSPAAHIDCVASLCELHP